VEVLIFCCIEFTVYLLYVMFTSVLLCCSNFVFDTDAEGDMIPDSKSTKNEV
jgi:hypothetical protein